MSRKRNHTQINACFYISGRHVTAQWHTRHVSTAQLSYRIFQLYFPHNLKRTNWNISQNTSWSRASICGHQLHTYNSSAAFVHMKVKFLINSWNYKQQPQTTSNYPWWFLLWMEWLFSWTAKQHRTHPLQNTHTHTHNNFNDLLWTEQHVKLYFSLSH